VQRASAVLRWTGSWNTVFVTVDRLGGRAVSTDFVRRMRSDVERYRMAGHDLAFDGPRYVSLELALLVCVDPGYLRSEVRAALLAVFGNRVLPGGRKGLFHPDNFSFGQTVYLSPLYAAARGVAGVTSVEVTCFQRQGADTRRYLDQGCLALGRLEVARLDNDPSFPERGVLRLDLRGGR
jgi:hypothetical protein